MRYNVKLRKEYKYLDTPKYIPLANTCEVCASKYRMDIENALIAGQPIATIASFYKISIQHIEHHKEICASYILTLDEFDAMVAREVYNANIQNHVDPATGELLVTPEDLEAKTEFDQKISDNEINPKGLKKPGSLRANLKLREADLLAASAQDLLLTQKNVSREINRQIDSITRDPNGIIDQKQFLRQPVCDMYTGIAGELRQTVRTLADIDKMLNSSETDTQMSDLRALSFALERSREDNSTGGAQMTQAPLPPPSSYDDV